ncbi:MAG: hypothetical protein WBF72_09265 [Rhodanobacter sp.]
MALQTFGDERMLAYCAFCGGSTGTRDHCPSRVFLDSPFPDDLPVVPACSECNGSFSADEQYLACLVSCVLAGSADPDAIRRPSIRKTLEHSAKLRARIEKARSIDGEQIVFAAEQDRVNSVITKLAQGHALYELHEPRPTKPDVVWAVPLALLSETDVLSFERPGTPEIWPEVGSRAMQRLIVGQEPDLPWIVVQPGMYRYLASPGSGTTVHIVIQEYLAGYVHWE